MKAPITIAVLTLHVAIVATILVQPGCKSSEGSLNPEITSPAKASEVQPTATSSLPTEGSANLRAVPTRPVEKLAGQGINEVPVDSFVKPSDELIAPAAPATIDHKTMAPGATSETKYVVKKGDNITKIARTYDTTSAAIMDANGLKRDSMLHAGQVLIIPVSGTPDSSVIATTAPSEDLRPADSGLYIVQKGDSLSKIAIKHHTSVSQLMTLNSMNNTNIRVGQKLKVPGASSIPTTAPTTATHSAPSMAPSAVGESHANAGSVTHKVASGETLGGIAKKYGVTVASIMEANGIKDARKLKIGQILTIKNHKKDASTPSTTLSVEETVTITETVRVQPDAPQANPPANVPSNAVNTMPGSGGTVEFYDL